MVYRQESHALPSANGLVLLVLFFFFFLGGGGGGVLSFLSVPALLQQIMTFVKTEPRENDGFYITC